MNILVVQETDWLEKGPHDQHHLAEKLSLRGHEIRVIDYEIRWKTVGKRELYSKRKVFGNITKIYDDARVTLIRPGIIKIPWLDYVSLIFSHKGEINRQIKEFAPDLIIGFGIPTTYLAMRAAKRNDIPFVYYWIDTLHTLVPFKPFQPIAKVVERTTLRQADMVLATNKKLRARVVEFGAHPGLTYVLRHGIDLKRFNPDLDTSMVREQYGIKKNDIVLLFAGFFRGKLYNISGLREVVFEFSRVNDPHFKFLIVGEGDAEAHEELRQMGERHNLQERLILTGKRPYDEIPALIAASHICLLTYHNTEMTRDLVPLKIFDYMAMKKPLISTKLPGMVEEFGEDNGIVYADRPEDVVRKAMELVSNGNLNELGAKARRFVEKYNWDSITDEFERILSEAIEEKKKQAGCT